MTLDDDLHLSCLCGCTTIQIRGGYSTQTIRDVEELGLAATTLCRRKRYRRVLWRWLLVAALAGVAGMAWVDGQRLERRQEAIAFCRLGERKLQAQDDKGAAEEFTKALERRVEVRTLLYRSFCYWRLQDYEACEADIRKVLEIDPGNKDALDCFRQLNDALGTRRYASISQ